MQTNRTACLLFLLIVATLLSCPGRAWSATADVTSFNAVFQTTPTSHDQLSYAYNASWSTSGLQCNRYTQWYVNSSLSESISSAHHYTSPVDIDTNESCTPHTMGSGNYYKILVNVAKLIPWTVYAEDAMTDGDLNQ